MSNGLILFILAAFAAGGGGGRWRARCRFGSSVPRRQRQLLVLVSVVDGGFDVHHDGVAARDFGGNVEGEHGEDGVAAGSRVRGAGQSARCCASHGTNRNSSSSSTPFTVFSTRFTFLQRKRSECSPRGSKWMTQCTGTCPAANWRYLPRVKKAATQTPRTPLGAARTRTRTPCPR